MRGEADEGTVGHDDPVEELLHDVEGGGVAEVVTQMGQHQPQEGLQQSQQALEAP